MLSISTLPEALAFLSEKTHHQWLEAELFDLVSRLGIRINAVAPSDAQTTIQTFEIGKGLIEKFRLPPGHSLLAVLFPFQTAELWQRGETKTSHPSDWNQIEGEDKLFLEPVRVTSADVRIRGESLAKILGAWNEAQEGGMWVSRFPKWMHPENEKLLQTDPSEAESKDVGETLADNSRVFTKRAMVAELKGIWPSITGDLSEASREKGELKAANVQRGYWNVDMCIKWAVAHRKITNNQQLKNYVIEKDDSPFAALLKTLFKI